MAENERQKKLVLEAAECFIEHRSPFEGEWLSEFEVTLDECMWLSEYIGETLRAVALQMGEVPEGMVEEFLLTAVSDLARKRLQEC